MAESIRNLSSFKQISNTGTVKIIFIPDTKYSIVLSGRQEDLDRTFTVVSGDTLVISQDSHASGAGGGFSLFGMNISFGNGVSGGMGPVTATVHAPAQVSIENTGTGSFACDMPYSTQDNLEIRNTGAGSIGIERLDCSGDLLLDCTGTGSIRIDGKAQNVKARSMGMGTIYGKLEYRTIDRQQIGMGRIDI